MFAHGTIDCCRKYIVGLESQAHAQHNSGFNCFNDPITAYFLCQMKIVFMLNHSNQMEMTTFCFFDVISQFF